MAQNLDWQVIIDIATNGGPQSIRELRTLEKAQAQLDAQNKQTSASLGKQEAALKSNARAMAASEKSANNLRYANYDLANTLLTVSAGIAAIGAGTATAFASQESAFTTVERIVSGNSESIKALRGELQALSTQIPVSFQDLSEIASLGAALDIPAESLAKFTEVVAKFSATTGVSTEQAAAGFGRLAAYFEIDPEQFDALGSAILRAGNVSVATEEEVLKFSQALALAGDRAGFTAEQTVALGAGIASFGRINVEGAGSALSRITAQIDMATAQGGQKLENFAKVAGYSAEQFRLAWGSDSFGTFQRILQNLNGVENANLVLKELGINNERDSRVILALSQNYDKFNQILGQTTSAWREGVYMNEAYGRVLDDIASKFQMFLNAVTNAAAAIGATFAPALGQALDELTKLLVRFADFANSDFGQFFLRQGAVILGLVAAWAGLRGGIALATASTLAFKTATSALDAPGFAGQIRYLATQLGLYTPAVNGASRGTINFGKALTFAAKSTIILGFVSLLISAFTDLGGTVQGVGNTIAGFGGFLRDLNWGGKFNEGAEQIRDFGNGIVEWGKTLPGATDYMDEFEKATAQGVDTTAEFDEGLYDTGNTALDTAKKVRTLTDYTSDLQSVWDRAFQIRFDPQSTLDTIATKFQEMRDAAKETSQSIRQLQADLGLLNADLSTQQYFLGIAEKYGDEKRAQALRAQIAKTQADIADKTADLNAEQQKQNKTLTGNTQAARDNRSEILGLVQQYQAHIAALAASGLSEEELARQTAILKQDFIAQATQLGYNRNELGLYTAAFDDVKVAIDNVPRNITVTANIDPAIQALNEFVAKATEAGANAGTNWGTSFGKGVADGISDSERAAAAAATQLGSSVMSSLEASMKTNADLPIFTGKTNSGSKSGGGGFSGFNLPDLGGYKNPNTIAYDIGQWLNGVFGWADGGYTGAGGKYEPAGIVHRGEYVIPKQYVNQATGLPHADALGRLQRGASGRRGYSGGGYVSGGGMSGHIASFGPMAAMQMAQAFTAQFLLDSGAAAGAISRQYAVNSAVGGS